MKLRLRPRLLTVLGWLLISATLPASLAAPVPQLREEIRWLTLDSATSLAKMYKRHVLVYIYTDWCGYCQIYEQRIFKDQDVVKFLNNQFLPVRINAWNQNPMWFQGEEFPYDPELKANTLALFLLQGRMDYPSWVVLNQEGELVSPISGYMEVPELMKVLGYYAHGHYERMSWDAYNAMKQN